MAKKFCSIIIVPHTKTNFRTIAFSKRTLKAATIGGGILVLLLVAGIFDYVSLSVMRHKYRVLVAETSEQQQKITEYEASIDRLKSTISGFEAYTKKLNVMAGLKSPDIIRDPAGLGGSDPAAEGASGPQLGPPPGPTPLGQIQSLNQRAENVSGNLVSLVDIFENQAVRLASTPTVWPVMGWLSSPFGYRADPFTGKRTFHAGLDIATGQGNPVVATADGLALEVTQDKFLGKNVTLSHGNGATTVYGHLSAFAVKAGQKVRRGSVIGYIGMTGKALGPHLHYEVHVNGKPVNPYNYILEE
jgi:murein DD-endopeptidase MepM/ murein hydrolase activator NlpD